ncbi:MULTISPECIES: serpin family protein [Proteiniphilum]|uniref:serpin family protein n=1 Tax=Proteiniphilum TaxID=294702 RepID=UPI001EECA333|nr:MULTISPECIES: serpin family protein [Proteiniphilum]ULB34143.1 serpin family protein [Proteiniphilum propionicum]
MRFKTYPLQLAFVTAVSLLACTSCDKNSTVLDGDNLPKPIKINLRLTEQEMLKSDHSFAFEFFEKVFVEESADKDKNFMVSPLSLSMALAMTWNGADGETKDAIQKTLKLSQFKNDEEINQYYKKLRDALLKTDPSTKLAIANSIWTNRNVPIKPEFISANKDYFSSTVESADFTDVNTVNRINRWAADNTNNLIDHVLDKTNPMDLMYLLNAIYFKGIWTSKFDPKNTSKKPFTCENGTVKSVEMMHQKSDFNYTGNQTFQMVQLPYGNQAFSMLLLLPNEGKKITDITAILQNNDALSSLKSGLSNTQVDIFMPRFKTEYSKRLNDVLKNMGMEIAFKPGQANFSRMSDISAFISFVDQFTYINTDEVGTEAAAVTVVGVELTSYQPPKTVTFNANRPFIYIIQENSTGSILFMGAVKGFNE